MLAMFKTPENYVNLKKALEDVIKDVERLQQIKVGDMIFNIEYFMGGDWKFLASITGVDAASSNYACIWCKFSRAERFDPDIEWSLTDSSKGARSVTENMENAVRARSAQRYNVSNPPLFPTIPLSRVVIDNLHLFLRVADVLINLLITDLRREDSIDQRRRFNGQFKVSSFKHLESYEKFVTSLGIPSFQFYVGEASKQLKRRSLTGPEKLKLFENINKRDMKSHAEIVKNKVTITSRALSHARYVANLTEIEHSGAKVPMCDAENYM